MSNRRRRTNAGVMLELWRSPPNAGDPIGCLATTYTFTPGLFDEQCLSRFLEIESEPDREDLAFLLERENHLGSVYAGVLVDHTQAGVEHSLRWDVLPVRVRSAKQHAKLSLLAWRNHIRIIVASANLTEPGYRTNHEVAATVDLSPTEADMDLLIQAITFLRNVLALVPGAREGAPEVERAASYLSLVEQLTKSWKKPRRNRVVFHQLACTLPATRPNIPRRSSLDEAIATCRRYGTSPYEAWVASPFFDVEDDSGRMAAALCKSMARNRTREICFCVPGTSSDGESSPPRLVAPKTVATIPSKYQGRVTVEVLPNVDDENNHRPWHAKMLAFLGNDYTALMIGSSNFTCAGMGAANYRNVEANLVTIVKRVPYGREAGRLKAIWPETEPVDDLDAAEWLGPKPESDEVEDSVDLPIPAGFVSATYRAGEEPQILLRLEPASLPPEWSVHACGKDERELLAQTTWKRAGSLSLVSLHWSALSPPDRLLVSWNGHEAFLPLNVEDAQKLPPPARLEKMTADDMLLILAAADPSAAVRAWAHKKQPSDWFDTDLDSATPVDLDPLRRHDLQATFLHRIRRRAHFLARLRKNLERPVWGRQALQWRLRGIIGIEALAERLVREISDATGTSDESLLILADFLIVLREVDYEATKGSLTNQEFDSVFDPFICDLAKKVQKRIAVQQPKLSPALSGFWQRVLDLCR